jgi:hypothetical protein
MKILSNRWGLSWGKFYGEGVPLIARVNAVAGIQQTLLKPGNEASLKVTRTKEICDFLSPSNLLAEMVAFTVVLDEGPQNWYALGVKSQTNHPASNLVEDIFRSKMKENYGADWSKINKKILGEVKGSIRDALARETPFRLGDVGALFFQLDTNQVIAIGSTARSIAERFSDGSIPEWKGLGFPHADDGNSIILSKLLFRQADGILPWPTGDVWLSRGKEKLVLQGAEWGGDAGLVAWQHLREGWHPWKLQLEDENKHVMEVGLSGKILSIKWPYKIVAADPYPTLEDRLNCLITLRLKLVALLAETNEKVKDDQIPAKLEPGI